jgi:hypothetical protein
MILAGLGKLGIAQAFSSSGADSTNVIDLGATANIGLTDAWLVIDTEVVAAGNATATYKFALVLSLETTLDTNLEVVAVTITGYADARLATAGKHILAINVGKMIKQLASATYRYLGVICTLGAGSGTAPTVSANIALSPTEPPYIQDTQVVVSPVDVPAVASAGSGLQAT